MEDLIKDNNLENFTCKRGGVTYEPVNKNADEGDLFVWKKRISIANPNIATMIGKVLSKETGRFCVELFYSNYEGYICFKPTSFYGCFGALKLEEQSPTFCNWLKSLK